MSIDVKPSKLSTMPSGAKKRRAAKKKKELETILNSRGGTISQYVIDSTSSINDASVGDYPVVETSPTVDTPQPEDNYVKDDIDAVLDEVELSPRKDGLNVWPLFDAKTSDHLDSLIVSDLKNIEENFALILKENEPFLASNQDSALKDVYKEVNLVASYDNPLINFASDYEKCSKESEGGSVSKEDAFSLPTLITPNVNKENLLVESGGAPLSPLAPDQARNQCEDDILQIDGALLASNNSKTSPLHQNSLVGILSRKEIAVEDKNGGHDKKIMDITEQINCLKKAIEEVLIATKKLRELLMKLPDDLVAIQLKEAA